MTLTAVGARNAKARAKPYKLAAGAGLYLEIMPTGARYWRLKYRYGGKEKRLALGVFPEVSLAAARLNAEKARALLRDGIDPSAKRRADRISQRVSSTNMFEAIAREWLGKQGHLASATFDKAKWTLETHAFPWLGKRPISEISSPELLAVLRRLESRGKLETAQRLHQRCSQVFRYAIATGRAERDPAGDLRGALATPKKQHRAALTDPKKIAELLRAVDGYSGNFMTLCALKLSSLVFLRPGEIRKAEWSEFDLRNAEWRVPAHKMKMRSEHIVPLSKQAVSLLEELHPMTGHRQYLFPSVRDPKSHMSENTVNAALRRLGYTSAEMTAHGFRAMASTRLNELGWATDAIERQLAHVERNRVRAAYNRAQYLPERRKMMQAWADYLDQLRAKSESRERGGR
jgi:integrase